LNVEYKKYNCSSDACPYLENCRYFLAFCKEIENNSAYYVTNFPCFLVVISGPYFSVSDAVFANVAIVDPLTVVFLLIWQKYDETMMISIAKTFHALKISLKLLNQYYANVDELIQDVPQTAYSVHPSFPEVIIDDKSYMVQINSQISTYLLWELLAEVGYAPKVIATLVIPGNWLLIYIECLNNHSILHNISNLKDSEQNSLKKKIKEVIEYLYNLEHIHGDLCEGNILVRQLEDNEFDVKLIDFEWSGKVGSAHYSPLMNREDI
ncbi:28516_t:CDS:2, partial [Racocetra persica]